MVHKDTGMPDDTVTTSWKRLTDKVKTSGGESMRGSLARTTQRRKSHADSLGLVRDAAASSSPTHAGPAAAGCPTDLATWEDEGGTTVP
jgi:hypothetical protein